MWPGPYGDFASRKYILASAEQSLTRMGLDYVDIFYSHRVDPVTPIAETVGALDTLVRQGKALYVGISSYSAERTAEAVAVAKELGTPLVIHQPAYSILNRWVEDGLTDTLQTERPRRHRLHAARAGTAHRQVPRRRHRRPRAEARFAAGRSALGRRRADAAVARTRSPRSAGSPSRSSRCSGRCATRSSPRR